MYAKTRSENSSTNQVSVSTVTNVFLLIAALVLFSNHAFAQAQVQLSSRTVEPSKATTDEFIETLRSAPSGLLHGLATFSRHL